MRFASQLLTTTGDTPARRAISAAAPRCFLKRSFNRYLLKSFVNVSLTEVSIRTLKGLRKTFFAAVSVYACKYTRKLMKRGQMDTEKKVRISAALDADQHRRLKADCAMKGIDINEVIVDLVSSYLSGGMVPPDESGDGDNDPLCSMVRACVEAGEPWRTAIRGVVVAIYEKMRRES